MQNVLEVTNLSVLPIGGGDPIVRNISFAVKPGEVIALIGESGSGKTTIALTSLGYTRPGLVFGEGSSVRLLGQELINLNGSALRGLRGNKVAYIAQSAAASFNPAMPLNRQVTESAILHGLAKPAEALETAVQLYREMELPAPETIGTNYPHQVSGGQLQRAMTAMALCSNPQLLVFDEPTTALDVTTQISVLNTFKTVIRQRNAAAIYVSHDLAVVAQVADHIIVLKNGQIVEYGSTEQIVNAPRKRYTKLLMAASDPELALEQKKAARAAEPIIAKSPPKEESSILEVRNVSAGYGVQGKVAAYPVLADLNLDFKRGSIVGVVGESGSGKSTFARVISGLLPSLTGTIRLNGVDLPPSYQDRSKAQLRSVQMVMQMADVAMNRSHTIKTILGRPLTLMQGIKGSELDDRVAAVLDKVQLPRDFAKRLPSQLSGGQKQRVNLARALTAEPELILCDEVTSALDTVVRNSMISLIDELRETEKLTFMFITHDISTVATLSDKIVVMSKGRIVEENTVEQIIHSPSHPYTQILMSSVPHMRIGWLEEAMEQRNSLANTLSQGVLAD